MSVLVYSSPHKEVIDGELGCLDRCAVESKPLFDFGLKVLLLAGCECVVRTFLFWMIVSVKKRRTVMKALCGHDKKVTLIGMKIHCFPPTTPKVL